MNNHNILNIDKESKAELIISYIDGNYTPSELQIIETLLANDAFSISFFESMTAVENSLLTLSSDSLSSKSTIDITNNILNKYTAKQLSTTKFKSYGWLVVAVSFIVLSIIGLYSINNSKLSLFTSIYAGWGHYIGTFYTVGISAMLLLLFDMVLKNKSIHNHHLKHN